MSSSTDTSGMEFEVFLSFRGSDTRDNFTSFLYEDMVEKGIRVFKDDKELQAGEEIKKLFKALDDSQIYIPIFSQDFASSTWCLDEVARMLDRTSESDGKKEILPIFLDVKPEDVKSRKRSYSKALSEHEKERDPAVVKRWREALREVTSRVGWKLEGKELGKLIKTIVREVLLKLKLKNRSLPDKLVEMDDEEDIEKLLKVDSADHVHFVIIHGTGGIGKTTLASIIFNRFWSIFDCSSFLEDVQDLSQRHGLLHVQKKLLSDTLGSTSADGILDTNNGINRIRNGLSSKKVLVVVDNVNEKKQLENLAGSCKWFGPGSRIIVTARDKRAIIDKTILDEDNQTGPSYYMDHPVKMMPLDRAIQLFSKHAFRSNILLEDWHYFLKAVVSSIGRLPLTLEVVGSLFARTDRSKWDKTLKDLQQIPSRDIRDTLMKSIDILDRREKDIFLDIACFCIGEDEMKAYYMWDDCGYSPRSAIDDLLLMSLIKIKEDNTFWMHDEVRDLGRYIVKEECFEDVGKRRWVQIDEKTLPILRSNKKKPDVRALSLGISHDLTPEEIACWPELRFLGGEKLNFIGDFKDLLPDLRWLSWHDCQRDFSATCLHLENLVVLNLSRSKITDDWGGWKQIEMATRLKVLDLTWCYKLTKTPNFSEFGELEKLILRNCTGLSTIDRSISELKLLNTLDIKGCTSLEGLPEEIGSLERLSEIIMPSSSSVLSFKLPETLGNLTSLTEFNIQHHSGFRQLPNSIGNLNLTHLVLSSCENLQELPDSIGELKSLVKLMLCNLGIRVLPNSIGRLKNLNELFLHTCKNLHKLPYSIGQLKSLVKLDLRNSGISVLPNSIGRLKKLKDLLLSECKNLRKLPNSIKYLESLIELDLNASIISRLPDSVGNLKRLKVLKVDCTNIRTIPELPSSLNCLVVATGNLLVLPNLSSLVHLHHLEVRQGQPGESEGLFVYTLPVGDAQPIGQLPPSLSTLKLQYITQVPNISDLQSLSILSISGGRTPRLLDVSRLKRLRELRLIDLFELAEIPGLGELESLKFLDIALCNKIKQLPNLSKLKNLRCLEIEFCAKLRAVEGLKELNSLKYVKIRNCDSLENWPDVPASAIKWDTDTMPWDL